MIKIKEALLRTNYESNQEQHTKKDGLLASKIREDCLVLLFLLAKILLNVKDCREIHEKICIKMG